MKLPASLLMLPLLLVVCPPPAMAHEVRPVVVRVEEIAPLRYLQQVQVPSTLGVDQRPVPGWPEDCRILSGTLRECGVSLEGRALTLDWPRGNPVVTTLFLYAGADGALTTHLLKPGETRWMVPERPSASAVAADYFQLGVAHILGGFDHLLFVLALLLLARDARRVLLAVTGFTLAHSVTLSLAALELVRVPVPPTEAVIALSILFLAREVTRPGSRTLVQRHPVLVSSLFGLLHGLGFAAALAETGLPAGHVPWALLWFNTGVEVGQLAFILAVVSLYWLVARMCGQGTGEALLERPALLRAAGWLLGVPAAFWLVQRVHSWSI